MKKAIVLVLAASVLVLAAWAYSDKYQIMSEKKGFLGWGGRTVLLLDKESGETWYYSNNKWVSIPKVSEEVAVSNQFGTERVQTTEAVDKKAKAEEELGTLKAKWDAETKALQAKQAEDMKNFLSGIGSEVNKPATEVSKPVTEVSKPATEESTMVTRNIIKKKYVSSNPPQMKKVAPPKEEEGPPEWLQE